MSTQTDTYAIDATTEHSYEQALQRAREQLAAAGFGVLSEIDVRATLKQKLDVDSEPYLILGACNPKLAHQALSAEPLLGVLLPCNVVVYVREGQTHIAAVNAERMLSIVGNEALEPIAAQVRERLADVVRRAASSD